MDEKKRLVKQKALTQFNELLDSTTLKASVFGITVKPIHGKENVKKYLLDAFDEISTSYLTEQDSKEIFRKMNDYMYQATGELAWYRSSSYWRELLSDEVEISSETPKKLKNLVERYCKKPNSKYSAPEVLFILKKVDELKHQKNVSALIRNIQGDKNCPDSIKDIGEFNSSNKHVKRQRKVIEFYDKETGNKRK